MLFAVLDDIVEGRDHDLLEPIVDDAFRPEVALPVLDPFEVGDGDAAGVGQDVGHDKDAALEKDVVGGRRSGTVRSFDQDPRPDARRVLAVDDAFYRRGQQDFAILLENLLSVRRVALRKAFDRLVFLDVFEQGGDTKPVRVQYAAVDVCNADDLIAGLVHQPRRLRAHVSASLDDDARGLPVAPETFEGLVADDHAPAPGRLAAAARASEVERLSRHARRHRVPDVHGVGVHDPGHRLLVGVHVRGGDVALRADVVEDFRRVPSRDPLQLASRKFFGIADDAAFGAAERNVDDAAFPSHLGGESTDFVEGDIGAVAQTAFARSARDAVLDAEAVEYFQPPVVQGHGNVHDDFSVGGAEVAV